VKTLKQQDQLEIESVDDWESTKTQVDKMISERPDWSFSLVVTFKRKTDDEKANEIIDKRQLNMFDTPLSAPLSREEQTAQCVVK
jgi:hypothetical protein